VKAVLVVLARDALAFIRKPTRSAEVPLSRHVVHFDPYPVRVFEENGIVSGCEVSIFGLVDYPSRLLGGHEVMNLVDVSALARSKTQMVKTGSVLIESGAILARRRSSNQNPCTAPDTVDNAFAPNQRLHPQEMAQILPERNAALRIVDRQLNVRDPVDLDSQNMLS